MSNARELAQLPSVPSGRRNLIYNGAMQVAQRGTTGNITTGTFGYPSIDRYLFSVSNTTAAMSVAQDSDAPDGFSKSMKITTTTAATLSANHAVTMRHNIEGQDVQSLAYGSANAKQATVSFWVKSSLTGNVCVGLNTGAFSRIITSTITINSANTWEKKSITFAGDTVTAITNDNANRFGLYIALTAGSTFNSSDSTSWGAFSNGGFCYGQTLDLAGTLNATFQITGIQLEVGSVATEFEHRSYGEELALCQRYYQNQNHDSVLSGYVTVSAYHYFSHDLPVSMRASPSITLSYVGAGGSLGSATVPLVWAPSITETGFYVYKQAISSGNGYTAYKYTADAEL